MPPQKLPIGIQSFSEIIRGGYIYVDKTEYCHKLITGGKYYFLSRPRRFGKSLLIHTLKEIFEGNRELFKGLWIENTIEWESHPVVLLDFTKISKRAVTLEEGIRLALQDVAQANGFELQEQANPGRFSELIVKLAKEKQVAILVDEYDKPLIDHIDDLEILNRNRQLLKELFSVLKGNDDAIAFVMLTGVSKFSQVSIFSDLNNLNDITLDDGFSQMLGYTQEEILTNFPSYFKRLEEKWSQIVPDVIFEMKKWYNGYSWDGEHWVYNPFSILNLFSKNDFRDFWFATGTPTFLMKLIRSRAYGIFDLRDQVVSLRSFNHFDIEQFELSALLFQSGYLTIKSKDLQRHTVTLDFPNWEVENAFSFHLLAEFSEKGQDRTDALVLRMASHLGNGDWETFASSMQTLFAGIAYPIQPSGIGGLENYERYYHSMFYLVLKLLGYDIQVEVLTHTGRIDAVVSTARYIYIMEFKLGSAESAMAQIHEKEYALRFRRDDKELILMGIGFDVATRNIGDVRVERG